ncbi:ABC transporter substrate-binding protein [Quisquiliibacterium transsilvanicum]|uniref:ABC-type branched-subunit amino acid transport system substrate-binding protein n=1 Tax=Quisquiliibacterium transsilvanicum TaxID=1549638 RepID=A0A7W8HIL8_9BURK|nr:ABC transporter substrate-binding protein [Quisquiliibacterium transsilvanicum]MBB5272762.1 ABC-type branched-subunit amino acid transport system substrate-binding protein [Quisquiliibacterium transsilvanicum]
MTKRNLDALRRTLLVLGASSMLAGAAAAQTKNYGPGVTDTEIKIGQAAPYSGPASAYGAIGKTIAAHFRKVNDEGGINGRKINLISLDDSFSPPKTVEVVRRLVESENVLFVHTIGSSTTAAVQRYLNQNKVPQLFVSTGATKWGDHKNFPWTIGFNATYQTEGIVYARYLLKEKPDAKVAVLYQNDDFGKDVLAGFKMGLGEKAKALIVAERSYELTDPMIDTQLISLQASGADVLLNLTTPKFAAMSIRKVYEMGWKPLHILANVSASVGSVLKPAGLEKAVGIISSAYTKDPTDAAWANDPAMNEWRAFMKKYYPDGSLDDWINVYSQGMAQAMVQTLKQAGDDLSRENVMRQAANLKDLELPSLLPGIRINTGPTDYYPIEQLRLNRFDGKQWVLFGDVIGK